MSTILNAFKEAFLLIVRFNADFYRVLLLSLIVSGTATVIGALIGIPLGVALSESSFRGRRALLTLVHAFMGLPPVVVGLFTLLVIMRSGPLGSLELYYTPTAMVIVQVILATPIIAGFTHASMEGVDPRLGLQAMSLGATRWQAAWVKMREARAGLVAAVIAGLGRVMAEVGAVLIVGGNLKGQTRVLTTDIVMQTRMANYELALAEGIVLILLVVIINIFLTRLQAEKGMREIEKRVTGYPA
ncbi:MAG: ABC transporter permease [Actinobacteria bacterium]|nr:ABC transporter permease [Actinomycetota bacterium]